MGLEEKTINILHPAPYVERQVMPVLENNKMTSEVVWTYIVARKYQEKLSELTSKLCGIDEKLPHNAKIWLEVYLDPSRIWEEERKSWRSRADLAIGCIEPVQGKDAQIRTNGNWICIAESKWFDDIHQNSRFPNIYQLSQLIEHALLLHDKKGNFPDRVYVTLITPQYFKEQLGKSSKRIYWNKFQDYKSDKKHLEKDLQLCSLPFFKYDVDTLISRIDALKLNWVTFEELLGLSNLVEDHIRGKYRVTRDTWEKIFTEMNSENLFQELMG